MEKEISIWLENLQSKKQWRSYLEAEDYLTAMNKIPGASTGDYVSLFKDTLGYLMDGDNLADGVDKTKVRRNLIELEGDKLKLELLVEIRALESAWSVKYTFQLMPVSLDRIDIVEAKLRDVQEKLTKAESKLRDMEGKQVKSSQKEVHLQAVSMVTEKLNDEGLIIWDDLKHESFELTSGKDCMRVLLPGWYILNLNVYLRPQMCGGTIDLHLNGSRILCYLVPFTGSVGTSAALGRGIRLKTDDEIGVKLTKSPTHVGADFTLLRVGD
ncbi:hypothetical protein PF002_g18815 [Phytophthora fragariae]|uniref:Uncharacterized protein n=1 Tax=Phytophthora fragariae TaxID=53985 RepID=A0A6A3XY23_9STRA|nr:hypothetical protein PF002_g18815 [Phytophthora fragariae]